MEQLVNSDGTMAASNIFDLILSQVQHSCLNFQIQVSPFSAVISLKKSLAKDQSGAPLLKNSLRSVLGSSISSYGELCEKAMKCGSLETELNNLQNEYEKYT